MKINFCSNSNDKINIFSVRGGIFKIWIEFFYKSAWSIPDPLRPYLCVNTAVKNEKKLKQLKFAASFKVKIAMK
jgi:hypothetical protein